MRRYLNREEKNQFICIVALVQQLEGLRTLEGISKDPVWVDWFNRGVMTKEERKYIKLAHTYMVKFVDSVLNRLDAVEQDSLKKQYRKFDFKLIDDFTLQKLMRQLKDTSKEIVMDRELFYTYSEDIMAARCNGCKKDGEGCPLRASFEDNIVPEFGEDLDNCRYAYNLEVSKLGKHKRTS